MQRRICLTDDLINQIVYKLWLFGISQGQGAGLPNLLGARRKEPEQVGDSDRSPLQTPRDPKLYGLTEEEIVIGERRP